MIRWCFQNAADPYADGILQQLAIGAAFVPVMWLYEVSAVLAKSQRDGILTAHRVNEFLATRNNLSITVDSDSPACILTDVHRLAVAHRLTPMTRLTSNWPCVTICLWRPSTTN